METSFLNRFWEKVDIKGEDDCWEWKACFRNGYGTFWRNGKNISAHRMSWIISHGEIPDGLYVCHTCDNKKCVNPKHLFIGTAKDNFRDMLKKGRANSTRSHYENYARGEKSHNAKFTQRDVDTIRQIYCAKQMTGGMLAKRYGVSKQTINCIIANKTWKSDQYVAPERWSIHNPNMRGNCNEQ